MSKLFIYGASGHGRVVLDVCQQSNVTVHGFIDDNKALSECSGYPVIHAVDASHTIIPAVGRNTVREQICTLYPSQISVPVIHPTATVAMSSQLEKGTVVMARAIINPDARVGMGCIINTAAVVEHDCMVGNFSHVSPGAILCGGVTVKELTQIGAGAVVLPGLQVGSRCIVGAGAVVTRNVPDGTVVVGNPANPI